MARRNRKHPFKFAARLAYLFLSAPNRTEQFVEKSYDRISAGYDESWTDHMRDQTRQLIEQLRVEPGEKALDLTCGTGYATNLLTQKTGAEVVGVDKSAGMIQQAQDNCDPACRFVHSDILAHLKTLPDDSVDIVTCCWGLGYSRPLKVLRQIRRILKPRGKVGIIDNSIFSLREVMYCSIITFIEQPHKLQNLMRFRFLTGKRHLALAMRFSALRPRALWSGQKSYTVHSGPEAIERLQATGAAAGFEFAADPADAEEIFQRFARIIEAKYLCDDRIALTHRYLAGIAEK